MVLGKNVTLKFYKKEEIQKTLIDHAVDKEVGVRYGEGFGKRPDILTYPREIIELALKGMSSLHVSEERWLNPLALSSEMSKAELEALRSGWDLVLDIDCAIFEYSTICADLVIKFLRYCGVKDFGCKFSGNKGWHIGIPFEAFPAQVGEKLTKDLFPEAPKKIALFITEKIKDELARRILDFENNDLGLIKQRTGVEEEIIQYTKDIEGTENPILLVEKFLEIDTVLISSRHLYRMPYSLHEKSGLVSLPIDPNKLMEFEKRMADPSLVLVPLFKFLDRDVVGESARDLLAQALDFEVKGEEAEEKQYQHVEITSAIQQVCFPPCIKKILLGMQDGKKRGMFCLMNFLGKIGWTKDEINTFLREWNVTNPDPLREVYIRGQMNSFVVGGKLPPNCNNEAYYTGLEVCEPDSLCGKIRNPVNYSILRWRRMENQSDKKKE
tara:strand:+ start:20650 stop:21969 length:1320 start_codon:yes stop_codon:yes gene_type:complete